MAAFRRGIGDDFVQAALLHRSRIPLIRVLFLPLISYRPDVRRFHNLRYGDARRGHLLDVYASRHPPQGAPVLIYLHGGGFLIGSKMLGARPLLYRLASRGWVCVSANYRLSPRVSYGGRVIDVKRVIAWVREHGAAYGADPSTVILAGGSAGAHLAATAALTVGDARFQPGFEAVDTSVSAVVAMYGYYGPTDSEDNAPSSPLAYLHAGAPPFLIIHGTLDTLVLVEDARHFADELASASDQPVVYAELPGTQHNFDFFHSLRFHAVTDAVESFVTCVRGGRDHALSSDRIASRTTPISSNTGRWSNASAASGACSRSRPTASVRGRTCPRAGRRRRSRSGTGVMTSSTNRRRRPASPDHSRGVVS